MEKLKKCPFCKKVPRYGFTSMGYGNGRGYPGNYKYYISCENENCFVRPKISATDIYEPKDKVIAKLYEQWNNREEK